MPDLYGAVDLLAYYFFGLKILLFVVAGLIFLSSLDDFFTDICFLIRSAYRRWFVMPRHRPMTVADLDLPEQRIAILIPLWQESAVIERMLTHLLATLDYRHYRVFVGVYPNDEGTNTAINQIAHQSGKVHAVSVPHPGPTSKGDCLNAIFDGLRRHEAETGEHHAIIALHDAEDIVHPLELKLFNKLIPRKDMVQLPVLPLEAPVTGLTGGHYMDEFAEHHTKDLAIREALTGALPSAGVGCAFGREAFARLAEVNNGKVFNTAALTEDYQISMRLREMGKKLIFVRFFVERPEVRRRAPGSRTGRRVKELVGTREYFPTDLKGAYRQKARWLIGIAFQAWREFGWHGSPMVKYAYFRDRKAVISAQVNILAYVVVISVLALLTINWLNPESYRYPPLVEQGSWLYYLLIGNAFFLLNRLVQRAFYTYRIYGAAHAALSPVRLVWGNFVNFLASTRAIWLAARALIISMPIGWEKTRHHFPSPKELGPYRRRLGDLLVASGMVDETDLGRALAHQTEKGRPLGEILVDQGAVTENEMLSVVAGQHGIRFEPRIPEGADAYAHLMRPASQQSFSVVPVGVTGEKLTVASFRLLPDEVLQRLEHDTGHPIQQILCPRAAVERRLSALGNTHN